MGSDELWDRAEAVMTEVLQTIEAQSEGRIKTGILRARAPSTARSSSITLKDAIGREWQCGTTQVDFNLPSVFGAFYHRQRIREAASR